MNRPTVIGYTTTYTALGVAAVASSLTGRGAEGLWLRGEVLRIIITKTAGPATTVSFQIKDSVSGDVLLEYLLEPLDMRVQPLPVPYEVAAGANLQIEAWTDDGTTLTDLSVIVDIKGPF